MKKVWAPNMTEMDRALNDVDAKVVVLQAFTRDLNTMSVEEMNTKIAELVNKALEKAEKVVLSTIIRREDVKHIDLKGNIVNAHMISTYIRNERLIICDNFKLYDSDLREDDKIHLREDNGVPIFATNLKYAIAEASGVEVVQKQQRRNFGNRGYQRNQRDHRTQRDQRNHREQRRGDYRRR